MFKSIIPATDWFFVHPNGSDKPVVWPLAAWGLTDDGNTVGLVGASEETASGTATLSPVPPNVGGRYFHRDELTAEERVIIANRSGMKLQRMLPKS